MDSIGYRFMLVQKHLVEYGYITGRHPFYGETEDQARQFGLAAGHAFRAAELAYDMGVAHGRPKSSPKPMFYKQPITFRDGILTGIPHGFRLFAIDWGGKRWEVKVGESLGQDAKSFQLERIVQDAVAPVLYVTIPTDELPPEDPGE